MKSIIITAVFTLQIFFSFGQTVSPRFTIGLSAGPQNSYFIGQPIYSYRKVNNRFEKWEVPSPGFRADLTASARVKNKHYFQTGLSYRQNKYWWKNSRCGFTSCFDEVIDINLSFLTISAGHQYQLLRSQQIAVLWFNGIQTDFSLDYWPGSSYRLLAFSYLTKLTAEYSLKGSSAVTISPLFFMALSRYNSKNSEVVDWPYGAGLVVGYSRRI